MLHSFSIRYFCILACIWILFVAFPFRFQNATSCMPLDYEKQNYEDKVEELTIGFYHGFAFLVFELCIMIFGVSTHNTLCNLMSIACHVFGFVSLYFFMINVWECDLYWWIFIPFILFPAILDFFYICVLELGENVH